MILLVLAGGFLWQMAFSPHLSAFTIIEKKVFKEGPYLFKLQENPPAGQFGESQNQE